MTYFTFGRVRYSRAEEVYVGKTLLGRVVVQRDWRARLKLDLESPVAYNAIGLGGQALPESFTSRHDAAEALYESVRPGPTVPDDLVARRD